MSIHAVLEAKPVHTHVAEEVKKGESAISAAPTVKAQFHLTLLDASGTETKRRVVSASVSLFLQCLLIGLLLLIPLMMTDTLPTQQLLTFLEAAPPPPPPPPPAPAAATLKRATVASNIADGHLKMPSRIPQKIQAIREETSPPSVAGILGGVEGGVPGGQLQGVIGGIVSSSQSSDFVLPKLEVPQRLRISQGISAGRLAYRVEPKYPLMAQQARIEGAVVLTALISKQGTIENLQLISGHPMLVQAAVTAVAQWRYRPYLLNGEPVEIETTITVNFKLNS